MLSVSPLVTHQENSRCSVTCLDHVKVYNSNNRHSLHFCTLRCGYSINFLDPICVPPLNNYTEKYYEDPNNFNDSTIWYNEKNDHYMHPEQMEFNIQGLTKEIFYFFQNDARDLIG